jgi:hypothetical protein
MPMPTSSDPQFAEILARLRAVQRRVVNLMILVMVLLLFTILLVACVYGSLVNYWSYDAMFYGATAAGAAILGYFLGFLSGWLARRRT